ncbi:MAG TPA: hypothetical protein VFG69_19165 [Nannocystaceae bacterium]|nr:hypothetical protein [Nannocystaceae bacterium]
MPAISRRTAVDPQRRNQWLFPSGARVVRPADIHVLLPIAGEEHWDTGDLLLAQVLAPVGLVDRIENVNRSEGIEFRDAPLNPGTITVVVLAPRAGTNTCIAEVPRRPVEELHLHCVGGQAGLVVPGSQHSVLYRAPPTRVRVLARLGDANGRPINTRAFSPPSDAGTRSNATKEPQLVLVVGSDMDVGKMTAARRIIYCLKALGRQVVAGKATGVASLEFLGTMFDAGANAVADFADFGEPATVDLPRRRVLQLFFRLLDHLRASCGPDGVIVMGLADGIWYPETRLLLEDDEVRRRVDHVVFACTGVLDAQNGLAKLERWGYTEKIRAVSGRVANSGLLRAHLPEIIGNRYQMFDALDYDESPEIVAALFDRVGVP